VPGRPNRRAKLAATMSGAVVPIAPTKDPAREDPKGRRGAKKRGSLTPVRGTSALAIPPVARVPSSPALPQSSGSLPPDTDIRHIPTLIPRGSSVEEGDPVAAPAPDDPELGRPVALLPGASSVVRFDLHDHQLPSLKNVGRDADGRVLRYYRSEETALIVAQWVAGGASLNYMCVMLNMRPGVLKELYSNELAYGKEMADTAVATKAFEMAMSGESEGMTKFWLERRHGDFKKKDGADDGSIFNINIHV
jgi:hypothetical protein